jgi:hypothetical protein
MKKTVKTSDHCQHMADWWQYGMELAAFIGNIRLVEGSNGRYLKYYLQAIPQ